MTTAPSASEHPLERASPTAWERQKPPHSPLHHEVGEGARAQRGREGAAWEPAPRRGGLAPGCTSTARAGGCPSTARAGGCPSAARAGGGGLAARTAPSASGQLPGRASPTPWWRHKPRVSSLGSRISDLGSRISSLKSQVSDLGSMTPRVSSTAHTDRYRHGGYRRR